MRLRQTVLSLLTAGALCATMVPLSAFAAQTEGAPAITSATIADATSTTDANGNLYLTVPSSLQLAGKTFNLTTSEAVSFVSTSENAAEEGELYAYDGSATNANLRFAIDLSGIVPGVDVNLNTPNYSIDLASTDGVTWTGAFNDNFNLTMSALGQALNATNATLRAGTISANGQGNDTVRLLTNSDAVYTQLILCDPDAQMATVTYNYGQSSYKWTVPVGAPLYEPTLPTGTKAEYWYTDINDPQQAVDFTNTTVSGDITLNAELDTPTVGETFKSELDQGKSVLHIYDANDFTDFANNSSSVTKDQRVELMNDIDLGGATYTSMNFEGNFDGHGFTISNVTFNPNGSYAGMFSEIGEKQKIANVNLENISTGGLLTTYSGVLAGQVYGINETPRENCMVQNVHMKDCTVNGRTVGGIAGFTFACTVQYCSVEDTRLIGMANAGGITGLTYADINACYTDGLTLFALQSRGLGGIAGKLLESGNITNCWYEYSQMYGEVDRGSENNNLRSNATSAEWRTWNRSQSVWTLGTNSASFIQDAINYSFGN